MSSNTLMQKDFNTNTHKRSISIVFEIQKKKIFKEH